MSGIADLFILATGDSDIQIRAIVDSVQRSLREDFREKAWRTEGTDHYQWVILDYVDLVVHVFNEEKRTFYSLERLWGDAPREEVGDESSGDEVQLLQESESGSKA